MFRQGRSETWSKGGEASDNHFGSAQSDWYLFFIINVCCYDSIKNDRTYRDDKSGKIHYIANYSVKLRRIAIVQLFKRATNEVIEILTTFNNLFNRFWGKINFVPIYHLLKYVSQNRNNIMLIFRNNRRNKFVRFASYIARKNAKKFRAMAKKEESNSFFGDCRRLPSQFRYNDGNGNSLWNYENLTRNAAMPPRNLTAQPTRVNIKCKNYYKFYEFWLLIWFNVEQIAEIIFTTKNVHDSIYLSTLNFIWT